MQASIKVTREELYQEVWQTPIHRLSNKYGLSDVGLKKICKKLGVPTPPRGYWMRIKSGESIRRPPLPSLNQGQPQTYEIRLYRHSRKQNEITPETFKQDLPPEFHSAKPIRVSLALHNPHPLVAQTERVLSKAKPDDYGRLRPWRQDYLDIRVTPASLKRGLRIMDALVKGVEARGLSIRNSTPYRLPDTRLVIFGESIEFFLAEKVRRKDHVLTKKEMEDLKRYPSVNWAPKWDYEPTGQLSLNIDTYWAKDLRKNWSDSGKKRVEDLLDDFVLGAVKIAWQHKLERRRREEEQRKREEEERVHEEARRRQEMERQRLRDLESQAENWAKAGRIRAYVRAVEQEAASRGDIEASRAQLEEWAAWAKEHADNLDPVKTLGMLRKPGWSEREHLPNDYRGEDS